MKLEFVSADQSVVELAVESAEMMDDGSVALSVGALAVESVDQKGDGLVDPSVELLVVWWVELMVPLLDVR